MTLNSTDVSHAIEHILRDCTGDHAIRLEFLRHEIDYWIAAASMSNGGALVIKLSTPSSHVPSFAKAKATHDLVRSLVDIPMAEMIAAVDSCVSLPFRFSVQTRLAGEEWFTRRAQLEKQERDRALEQLGAIIARLHQPSTPGFGSLQFPKERNSVVALCDHAAHIIGHAHLRDRYIDFIWHHQHLWLGVDTAGITHDDLHGFNVLFDLDRETEISGILDFDKAWSGPTESDLARMELWRGMTGQSFLATYRAAIPEIPGYAERKPFYQLLWCLEFAQETTDHLRTTNILAGKLGFPPIEKFT